MLEEEQITPEEQLGGGGNKSPPGAPRKPGGGYVKTTSKGHPQTIHKTPENREGRTATSPQEGVNPNVEENQWGTRGACMAMEDKLALVTHRKTPSRGRRSWSRSPTLRRKRASSRKRSRSPTRIIDKRMASPRKGRSRSRSSLSEEGPRKHHRDRYERPDSDWEKNRPNKTKG
ncbi:uncharacterized protein LOC131332806 [Rhododendron vialii]|uniref:uncharacterized protein LOC131332806 n=1 Tax=Rhododendron vialii TaxID=182163 RepID=UPI00265E4581|nr:uncharacterized protein LOC131332806 [Rhododendron vialii]